MEALLSQLSFLANQALDDNNFDPSKIEELLALFEQEAYGSWDAEHRSASADAEHRSASADAKLSMKEAEDYLDSLMDAAMADFRISYAAAGRAAAAEEEELRGLERAVDATQKAGKSLGATAATSASRKYMDAAMASAVAAMKSAFASSKVHP